MIIIRLKTQSISSKPSYIFAEIALILSSHHCVEPTLECK